MLCAKVVCLVAACAVTGVSPLARADLVNGGFEDPITQDGPPFVGFWEAFNSGAGSESVRDTTMPRSGANALRLSIFNTPNAFAGAFQDVAGLTPGTEWTFSGWHKTTTDPLDVGVEIRIEWRDSVANVEISRTPNFTPVPGADYEPFTLSAMVPAGADTARVTYAIQTFGPGPTDTGTILIDDVSFIPAPGAAALALGGLALGLRRRR